MSYKTLFLALISGTFLSAQGAEVKDDFELARQKITEYLCVSILADREASALDTTPRAEPFKTYRKLLPPDENLQSPEGKASAEELRLDGKRCRDRYANSVLLSLSPEQAADEVATLLFDTLTEKASFAAMMGEITEVYSRTALVTFPQKPDVIWDAISMLMSTLQAKMRNELEVKRNREQNGEFSYHSNNFYNASEGWLMASAALFTGRMVIGGLSMAGNRLQSRAHRPQLWFSNRYAKRISDLQWKRVLAKRAKKGAIPTAPANPAAPGTLLLGYGNRVFIPDLMDGMSRHMSQTASGLAIAGIVVGALETAYRAKVTVYRVDPVADSLARAQKDISDLYLDVVKNDFMPDLEGIHSNLGQNSFAEVEREEELRAFYQQWKQNREDLLLVRSMLQKFFSPAYLAGTYNGIDGPALVNAKNSEIYVARALSKTEDVITAIEGAFAKRFWPLERVQAPVEKLVPFIEVDVTKTGNEEIPQLEFRKLPPGAPALEGPPMPMAPPSETKSIVIIARPMMSKEDHLAIRAKSDEMYKLIQEKNDIGPPKSDFDISDIANLDKAIKGLEEEIKTMTKEAEAAAEKEAHSPEKMANLEKHPGVVAVINLPEAEAQLPTPEISTPTQPFWRETTSLNRLDSAQHDAKSLSLAFERADQWSESSIRIAAEEREIERKQTYSIKGMPGWNWQPKKAGPPKRIWNKPSTWGWSWLPSYTGGVTK